jgi:hypothetical protein
MIASIVLSVSGARAQNNERTLAEALFREARELMRQERYGEACPKLAESQRLDPGAGTLLNLAVCHDRQGRTATAWGEYHEALTLAKRDGRADRQKLARERLAALEPELARVSLKVPEQARVAGLRITVQGGELAAVVWDSAIPVDPGEVVIEASAPGKRSWQTRVNAEPRTTKSIEIPVLSAQASKAVDRPKEPASADRGEPRSSQRTVGFIAGGIGVVGLGVGTYFGITTIVKKRQADQECPNDDCTTSGEKLDAAAKRSAWLSNIGFGVGLVGVAVGTYLVLTAKDETETGSPVARRARIDFAASAGTRGGSFTLTGHW